LGGTLDWLVRREPRGLPLAGSAVAPLLPPGARAFFARLVRPDGRSRLRVGVALVGLGRERQVCATLYEPLSSRLAGCAAAASLFARHDVIGRALTSAPGGQRVVLVGLAAPGVSELRYLDRAAGATRRAPLRDGVFAIALPRSSFPLWLYTYTREGRLQRSVEGGAWPPPASG
jgi:hypothetical protein